MQKNPIKHENQIKKSKFFELTKEYGKKKW